MGGRSDGDTSASGGGGKAGAGILSPTVTQ
jgi:hypothetical protein